MAETKEEEHGRLMRRTAELQTEHTALSRDIKPFDKAEHDKHRADLAQHHTDLAHLRERDADDTPA
jgi:hypothetical protein